MEQMIAPKLAIYAKVQQEQHAEANSDFKHAPVLRISIASVLG